VPEIIRGLLRLAAAISSEAHSHMALCMVHVSSRVFKAAVAARLIPVAVVENACLYYGLSRGTCAQHHAQHGCYQPIVRRLAGICVFERSLQ
jgi:hypothetical protein